MVTLRVIEGVDEPTEWCSVMVAFPKQNGSFRISVQARSFRSTGSENIIRFPWKATY